MPSGRWQSVTMVFRLDPSAFIEWMRSPLSSRTNRRPGRGAVEGSVMAGVLGLGSGGRRLASRSGLGGAGEIGRALLEEGGERFLGLGGAHPRGELLQLVSHGLLERAEERQIGRAHV